MVISQWSLLETVWPSRPMTSPARGALRWNLERFRANGQLLPSAGLGRWADARAYAPKRIRADSGQAEMP
jgi:hypothetical protein